MKPEKFLADIEPVTPKAFNYSQPILSMLRLLTQKKQRWESHGRFNPKRPWKMSVCEFVETFGGVFSSFREGREWYVLVDVVVVTTLSVIQGLVVLPCGQLHVMVVIVQAFDLVCIVLLHPHHTLRDHVLDVIVYIAKLFMVFPLLTPPQHPIRQASEVAGVVVFALSAYSFVIFFVRMFRSKTRRRKRVRIILALRLMMRQSRSTRSWHSIWQSMGTQNHWVNTTTNIMWRWCPVWAFDRVQFFVVSQ